jgi:hypothetical protein
MDQGTKSSMKILGAIAIVAIVGVSAYSMMRSDSLDQSGQVIDSSKVGVDTVPVAKIVKSESSGKEGVEYKDGEKSWHQIGNTETFPYAYGVPAFHEDGNYIYIAAGGNGGSRIKRMDKNGNGDFLDVAFLSNDVSHPTDIEVHDGNLYVAATSGVLNDNYQKLLRLDLSPLSTQFQNININSGADAVISSLTEFNNKLYVGGTFSTIGNTNVPAKDIAYWDGINWQAVNSYQGFGGIVSDLVTYKDPANLFTTNGDSAIQANTGYIYPSSDPSTNIDCWAAVLDCAELVRFKGKMYVLALKASPSNGVAMYHLKKWEEGPNNTGNWQTLFEIPIKIGINQGKDRKIITADNNNIYIANVSSDGVSVVARWPGTGTTLYLLGEGLQPHPQFDYFYTKELFTAIHAPNDDHLYVSGYFSKSGTEDVYYFADWSVDGI